MSDDVFRTLGPKMRRVCTVAGMANARCRFANKYGVCDDVLPF